ncbi:MAG: hypothetical protein P1Q69_06930 [Candidatus Thorarchaeota archaeon]|nr:hypothetical protein [Candidatus Thorarchaeota archaeon]
MTTIPLPYCVPCGTMYRCKENEVIVDLGHAQVMADQYVCLDCGHTITMGYARNWLGKSIFEKMKESYRVIRMKEADDKE